ncbi:hypothetical protein X975_04168, partial [Stegodyphus mimosarum]
MAHFQLTKTARMSKSKIKSMFIYLSNSQGFVHKEFVPPGKTVSQHFDGGALEKFRKWTKHVRPSIKTN